MSPVALADSVVEQAEVLSRKRNGAYHSLTFVAPEIAVRARPGQFVMISIDPGSRCLLRRPFSISQSHGSGPMAGNVEVVFDSIGTGTGWLAARRAHDRLSVVGPLGRPYMLPDVAVTALLVGGGYGSAPLFWLAEELRRLGSKIHSIVGARSEARLLGALEAKRVSATTTITTEDGSAGVTGRVTDVIPALVSKTRPDVVYSCGPMPMLRAVSKQAAALGVPIQIAVEEFMACGIGVCWTCVVPMRTSRGIMHARSCTEGPVFDGAKVAWE